MEGVIPPVLIFKKLQMMLGFTLQKDFKLRIQDDEKFSFKFLTILPMHIKQLGYVIKPLNFVNQVQASILLYRALCIINGMQKEAKLMLEKAKVYIQRALDLNPSHAKNNFLLGQIYRYLATFYYDEPYYSHFVCF